MHFNSNYSNSPRFSITDLPLPCGKDDGDGAPFESSPPSTPRVLATLEVAKVVQDAVPDEE